MAYNNSDIFLQITYKNCVWHVSCSFYLNAIHFYSIFFYFCHLVLFLSQICQLATFNFTCPNPDIMLWKLAQYNRWQLTLYKRRKRKKNRKKLAIKTRLFHLTKYQGLLVCQPTLTLITGHCLTFKLDTTIVWFGNMRGWYS